MKPEDFLKQIEEKLFTPDMAPEMVNQGVVEFVGDGVVRASGLSRAGFGEEVEFENKAKGLVFNLDEEFVSVILLSEAKDIKEGMKVKTTGNVLGVNVSRELMGRTIDPVGNPLDGKTLGIKGEFYTLERAAPTVIDRLPVDVPLKTGIKAIDAIIPIGRGQRELIIGDRNTGKTAIALDAVINQKKKDLGLKQVICVYCSIGQKRGNLAKTIAKLEEKGAMDYTIVVAAGASDPAALQYIAPYTACSVGEYFRDRGEDVLVIYDDLSKHAWAYRQVSLLLKRPAGREAYPGDIFYLHSRLLERAAKLNVKNGGGSLTALPIIETQADDVSAYIPTNVISITDGQIYLETDLFNSGQRPAVNIGLSVSRVGGNAQSKPIKQVAGLLRLELAQFRELQAFAQFGSDLDEETLKRIERGRRLSEILKQPQYGTYSEASQILTIYAATSGALDTIPVEKVQQFEKDMLMYFEHQKKGITAKINEGKKMSEELLVELKSEIDKFKQQWAG
ncbi:MAG: F0F1 ATP synthase subunit alpha [Endomicrobiales bacterium]|nr:F0F1 ATP synthase subunit alpha [Endomicrobiales bacterium]